MVCGALYKLPFPSSPKYVGMLTVNHLPLGAPLGVQEHTEALQALT